MADLSLEIVEGPEAGRQIPLREPLTVGRAADAQVVLADQRVSRHHARIAPQGADAIVEDLGSSNGTFVNGQELHAPARVSPGDDILVGVTVLEVRSVEQIASQPSAVRPIPAAIAAQTPAPPPPIPAVGPPPPPTSAPPAPAPAPQAGPPAVREDLGRLLDVRVKRRAQTAPIAILALAAIVVLIYLAAK